MPNRQHSLNRIFGALSDPTRRAVVARLGHGPAAVSDLARPFDMALPSFTQHLKVLEECGLVGSQKRGRTRVYKLVTRRFQVVEKWLEQQHTVWEKRLDKLDAHLLEMQSSQEEKK